MFIASFLFLGLTAVVTCGNSQKTDGNQKTEKNITVQNMQDKH